MKRKREKNKKKTEKWREKKERRDREEKRWQRKGKKNEKKIQKNKTYKRTNVRTSGGKTSLNHLFVAPIRFKNSEMFLNLNAN